MRYNERLVHQLTSTKASLTQGQVDMIKKKRVEAFSKRLQKRLKDEAWVEQLSGGTCEEIHIGWAASWVVVVLVSAFSQVFWSSVVPFCSYQS